MGGSGTGTPLSIVTSFVVEDGSGKSTANSYLSVGDADTYHTNYTQSAAWAAAVEATKQRALILASQYLDAKYHGRWRGVRAHQGQAMDWPRSAVEDDDGYYLSATALPQKLQDACAELALRVVSGDDLLGTVTDPGQVVAESVTLGPIAESKTYAGGKPAHAQYPRVDGLLKALLGPAGVISRG
jgi:hypothetical protein